MSSMHYTIIGVFPEAFDVGITGQSFVEHTTGENASEAIQHAIDQDEARRDALIVAVLRGNHEDVLPDGWPADPMSDTTKEGTTE